MDFVLIDEINWTKLKETLRIEKLYTGVKKSESWTQYNVSWDTFLVDVHYELMQLL